MTLLLIFMTMEREGQRKKSAFGLVSVKYPKQKMVLTFDNKHFKHISI